jgi:uncharacterized protein involved in exopolysaccharide biosynthesis
MTDSNRTASVSSRSLGDYLAVLRRHRKRMTLVAGALLLIAAAIAFGLPPIYRSVATILIEQQELPPELVRTTVTSYADQRLQVIGQRVMTNANLYEIVQKYNLYPEMQGRDPREVVVARLRDDIKLELISADVVDPRFGRPTQATIAFSLSYDSRSPDLAQKVANEIATLYLNENLKSRTESAQETSDFLTEEADRLGEQIAELESKIADFKQRNVNRLPELAAANMQLVDRTEREILETDRQIRALEERKALLESQLATVSPNAPMLSETGERVLSPEARLKLLQSREASMAALYAEDHPDRVKARKEIAALTQEVGGTDSTDTTQSKLNAASAELADARKKYSPDHPDVKRLERTVAALEQNLASPRAPSRSSPARPDNPAYLQLRTQVDSTAAEIRGLRASQAELRGRLRSIEGRIVQTPQIEGTYRTLMRDYENAQKRYQEIRGKQMEAQLAQSMESERKGERFTLIEPPLLPETPIKPKRFAILMLGAVFAFAGGIASAAFAEGVDAAVHGVKGVVDLLRFPPLGVIPYIENESDRLKRNRRRAHWRHVGIGAFGAFAGLVVLFHLFVKPLDVLWFTTLRQFGL